MRIGVSPKSSALAASASKTQGTDQAKQLLRRVPLQRQRKTQGAIQIHQADRRVRFFSGEMKHCRKYGDIGRRLIRTLPEFEELRDADAKIAYLSSQREKSKNHKIIFAECCKVEEKYEWCCKYDFFIVVYEPNVANFSEHQLETLIRHELHHIGIEYTDTGLKFYVAPHDVEEFWQIIREEGLDWSEVNATRG